MEVQADVDGNGARGVTDGSALNARGTAQATGDGAHAPELAAKGTRVREPVAPNEKDIAPIGGQERRRHRGDDGGGKLLEDRAEANRGRARANDVERDEA